MKKFVNCLVFMFILSVSLSACRFAPIQYKEIERIPDESTYANKSGASILERFKPPKGFERRAVENNSFAHYLRNLPLKPHGSKVHTYDGKSKFNSSAYEAVIDMDIGEKNLQQCADAIMRLRAEYQFFNGQSQNISFKLTNGFEVPYSKWIKGWRVRVEGNKSSWVENAQYNDSYESFRDYMEFIFIYAGTLSLERDLDPVDFDDMKIGDVLVEGGSPGHAVIVVDMAQNMDTGEKLFMLAQSYMPAQDIHVLSNKLDKSISPWYRMDFEGELRTAEWTFDKSNLKSFQ